jgi:hypothetical protein
MYFTGFMAQSFSFLTMGKSTIHHFLSTIKCVFFIDLIITNGNVRVYKGIIG